MTSYLQKSKLKLWDFSDTKGHEVNFPNSYNDYQKLLAKTDSKRYTQDANKNSINLTYTFNALLENKGLGNIIIDVDASNEKGEIVKAKESQDVNEVILRNKIKTSEKIPLGLFRGSCGGVSSKKGFLNLSLFSDTTKECTPNQKMKQQIAFFPHTISSKGAFEKLFSDYSTVENRFGYLFYFGKLVMNASRVVYRYGEGKMLRRMFFGGYETIEGNWGGGLDVDSTDYNDNLVSEAIACRVSNSSEKTEGIAVGGNWLEGNYIGGACLSWRVYFGNDVVFNYTGALSDKYDKTQPKTQPIEGYIPQNTTTAGFRKYYKSPNFGIFARPFFYGTSSR